MIALFDTTILVDYLNGRAQAREELSRYAAPLISPVTWIEVMVGAAPEEVHVVRSFLARFSQVPVDEQVSEIAVDLRRRFRVRIPDALIWAAARRCNALLVTRNTRDFPADDPQVRVPYAL